MASEMNGVKDETSIANGENETQETPNGDKETSELNAKGVNTAYINSNLNQAELEPYVSTFERRILRKDWKALKNHVSNIGVITFLNLFENHSDVHEAFVSFRNMRTSELRYNMVLRSHALRVMGIVDTCICNIDDREKLKETMLELGLQHGTFKTVQVQFMDLMGPQAIEAIKPHLEGAWDKDHEAAWSNLFKLMAYHMKRGIAGIV